jgi:hypothetical protein
MGFFLSHANKFFERNLEEMEFMEERIWVVGEQARLVIGENWNKLLRLLGSTK